MKRSDLCSMTVEEAAWQVISNNDPVTRLHMRKMMKGEFGADDTNEAIDAADRMRELMGFKRRYLPQFLRAKLKERQDARTD